MERLRANLLVLASVVGLLLAGSSANAGAAPTASQRATRGPPASVPAAAPTPLIYVANQTTASVTAYPASASGNVRPVITLAEPHTRLNAQSCIPQGLAHDSQGRLIVLCANSQGFGQILVFARGANGDATPIRTLQVLNPPGYGTYPSIIPSSFAVDAIGNMYVEEAPYGNNSYSIAVAYAAGASGTDAAKYIPGGTAVFGQSQVAVNAAGQVYEVQGGDRTAPPSYLKLTAFAAGNQVMGFAPFQYSDTGSTEEYTAGVAVAPRSGNVYVLGGNSPPPAPAGPIIIYNPAFQRVVGQIGGTPSGPLPYMNGIVVDDAGQIFVTIPSGGMMKDSVAVFPPFAKRKRSSQQDASGTEYRLKFCRCTYTYTLGVRAPRGRFAYRR